MIVEIQYIGDKKHKFAIKLYKLCFDKGYTFNFQVYCGKDDKTPNQSFPKKVVLSLLTTCQLTHVQSIDNLLDNARTIYTNNYYTSISLPIPVLDITAMYFGLLVFVFQ